MKVGIIGQGFVGSAIREGLKGFYEVLTYDTDTSKCNSSHKEVCTECEIIFVCVPTPMRKSGECDTRILQGAVNEISEQCKVSGKTPVLVVKSTVPPGTTDSISSKTSLKVCFSPEFLTEANSFDDFKNQSRIIIGGEGAKKVKQMFRKPFPNIPIVVTKTQTAEMVKYYTNCFLATKVTFANQMYDICENLDIDYDKVSEYALLDKRIGKSHLAVPGPDGDRGYGGHCFPKDVAAMTYLGKSNDTRVRFLQSVEKENEAYRTVEDWKKMKGRAVSDD